MKAALITILLALAASGLQAAKDEKFDPIPKEKEGRWGIYSFEDAKKEAAKKKRPIAFVVQEEGMEVEASVKEAVLRGYWGVAKDCTMVLLSNRLLGEGKTRISAAAYTGITSPAMGKAYPRLVITDSTGEKLLGQMTSTELIAADEKIMKTFSRQMEDYNKDPSKVPATAAAPAAPAAPGAPAAPAAPAATPGAPASPAPAATGAAPAVAAGPVAIKDAKPENWTNAQGRTIQATLLEVSGDQAKLLLANGQKVDIGVATLSPASQKRIEELKAASTK